jgi:O-antigen ligase
LALMIAALVMLIARPKAAWLRQQSVWAASGAVAFVLLFLLVPRAMGGEGVVDLARVVYAESVSERLKLWSIAQQLALANPLFGVGPMHFAYTYNGSGAHPHNFWLQLAAEWGVPAAVTLGGLALILFARCFRAVAHASDADPAVSVLLQCGLAGLVVWGVGVQTDGFMVVPTTQLLSAAILAMAVAMLPRRPATPPSDAATLAFEAVEARLRAGLAALCVVVLAALPFLAFGAPTEREARWRNAHSLDVFWPRFWQMGWIGPDRDSTAPGSQLQ